MSPAVLIAVALAAGIVVGFIARKMSMSWVIAGGGGLIAAVAAFIVLAPSPPASQPKPEVQSAAPAIVSQPPTQPQPQPQPTAQAPQQQITQVDPAVQQRCIQQAKTQGYRSGQCAFTFIDSCIKTQSRKEMEAALRVDAMTGMGQALSCPNMPSTFAAEFDKF